MKYKFLFLLLLVNISFSQKTYIFDYLLEYEYQSTENEAVEIKYIYTNSKDNNYNATVMNYKPKYYKLFLVDDFTGVRSLTSIPTENIENVGTINLNCNDININRSGEVKQSKLFIFDNLKDTIINEIAHKHYTLDYVSKRKKKTYQSGIRHYLVENNTQFHKPMICFSYVFDQHVTSNNIPNGIAREMYSINSFRNNQKEEIYKLKSIIEINMKMVIPADCDKLINIK